MSALTEVRLVISLFGAFDSQVDGRPANLGLAGATRSLLAYLICSSGRLIRREQLMEMFWSNTSIERRRSSLNSAIWRIKKALRAANFPPAFALDASAECLRLTGTAAAAVDIDILGLADALAAASRADAGEPEVERLAALLERCGGIPLDGLDDDWAVVERERLRALRTRALNVAMRLLAARRRFDESLEIGRRILLDDPFHECALQEVLCIHALNGQRVRALRLFDEFSKSLEQELGIVPMAETRALRDYVAGNSAAAIRFSSPVSDGERALVQLGVEGLVSMMEHSRQTAELCS
jgi:DNA-binding SARP family transcriptional activator